MIHKVIPYVIAQDIHGKHRDEAVCDALFTFMESYKPKIRIINGDLFDLTCLRTGASPTEKAESLQDDFDYGFDFMAKFKPTHYNYGNHEHRLPKLLSHPVGEIQYCARKILDDIERECRSYKCEVRPYDTIKGILPLGKLNVLHAFGQGGDNCAKEHAISWGPCAIGHGHRIEHVIIASGAHRLECNMLGCICKTHLDYDSTRIKAMRQRNGWGYGFVSLSTGDYNLFQAQQMNGKWILPENFREL